MANDKICRGSYVLNTACGACRRCCDELRIISDCANNHVLIKDAEIERLKGRVESAKILLTEGSEIAVQCSDIIAILTDAIQGRIDGCPECEMFREDGADYCPECSKLRAALQEAGWETPV